MRGALVGLLLTLAFWTPLRAQGTEIGFIEDFALAESRAAVLDRLVPGTEPFYFYRALERQHAGDLDAADAILRDWTERRGEESRAETLRTRQAFLRFREDPERTWAWLRDEMGLDFDVAPPRRDNARRLPSTLAPELVDTETLIARALAEDSRGLGRFEDAALARLVSADLGRAGLKNLLNRLDRADLPGIPRLVARELRGNRGRGFGSLRVHKLMTRTQLDALAGLRPEVLAEDSFVDAYLRRLVPQDDVDLERDRATRRAHLDQLLAFANRLPEVHNSLKAHVLYHQLRQDLETGTPNAERLRRYLRLPRRSGWATPRKAERRCIVNEAQRYPTGFDPIRNDETLVRRYLMTLLADAASADAWGEYVREDYLRRLFAETKILAGVGDPERWASMIDDPSAFQRIKDRVEINFIAGNRMVWGADEKVALDVELKNVATLLVKVFEIDAAAYFASAKKDLDATVDLEGVVPAVETRLTVDASSGLEIGKNPFRRLTQRIELPSIQGAGSYVVELIGNGLSSRAVVVKGGLFYRDDPDGAGHRLRVFDEQNRPVKKATARLEGRTFNADPEGVIRIPFSARAGNKTMILEGAERAARGRFRHLREIYSLHAGVHIEREAVLQGGEARVLVRPTLRLADRVVPIALLEKAAIEVVATSIGGLASTITFDDLELSDNQDTVVVIAVPDDLARLDVRLRGEISRMDGRDPEQLSSRRERIDFNAITRGTRIAMPLLARTPAGYAIELRGRNGEPVVGRVLDLELKHRDLRRVIRTRLETDEAGRVLLGELDDIRSLQVRGYAASEAKWFLGPRPPRLPAHWNALSGETISIPAPEGFELSRQRVSLIEYRDGVPLRDHHAALALNGNFLEIEALPRGDHQLRFHRSGAAVNIRVVDGERDGTWLRAKDEMIAATPQARLQLAPVEVAGDDLVLRVANAGPDARIHLAATHYVPAFDLARALDRRRGGAPEAYGYDPQTSHYVSGRRISDEYRYILNRRLAAKLPGNMLPRPGLILNPWAQEQTNADVGLGGGAGGSFGGKRARKGRGRRGGGAPVGSPAGGSTGGYADLDFLAEASTFLVNLRPNERGEIRIPLKDLGEARLLSVVAIDRDDISERQFPIGDRLPSVRDLRLARSLGTDRRLAEARSIQFLAADERAEIEIARSSRVELFDDLASVYRFYRARIGASDLAQFDFISNWPALDEATKRKHYDEHACHELHVFLHEKDRPFFDAVVRPFLVNKRDRTFVDQWLLEEPLDAYLEPWAFARLNVVEKILLLRRMDGGNERAARYVSDLWNTAPEDPSVRDALFAAALAGEALAQDRGRDITLELGLRQPTAKPRRAEAASNAAIGLGGGGGGALGGRAPDRRAGREQLRGYNEIAIDEEAEEADEEEPEPEESLMDADAFAVEKQSIDSLKSARKRAKTLFRDPDPTRRYVEHNWWHRRRAASGPEMIRVNAFWRDFAAHDGRTPFISENFALAGNSFAEVMMALSFLDLPFRAGEHVVERGDLEASIRAASPLILLTKELQDARNGDDLAPVLVSETLYAIDPHTGRTADKPLDVETGGVFLRGVPYLRRVAITNPTPGERRLEYLAQVPAGAVPLAGSPVVRGQSLRLKAFGTLTLDDRFYFPAAGTFEALPPQVAEGGAAAAATTGVSYDVRATPPGLDPASWPSVARDAEIDALLAFLEGANLAEIDLGLMTWRMKDAPTFRRVTELLRRRLRFHGDIWAFGILHRDTRTTREYLERDEDLVRDAGPFLDSPLLRIDPVARNRYELAEFNPIINPRRHRFGARPRILDGGFAKQYLAFLGQLAFRPVLDADDHLATARYLLTQDRIEAALEHFARVRRDEVSTKIQYDYLSAYLAFYGEDPERARPIAERYRSHPVPRWRDRFATVIRQLDEARGQVVALEPGAEKDTAQTAAAAQDPSLGLELEGARLVVDHRNLDEIRVAYYEMDVEFLFSSSPFVQNEAGAFAYVKPNLVTELRLDPEARRTPVALPERFANANVLVEVRGAGLVRRQAVFANALSIAVSENYGQIQVVDEETGRPLKATYVKVFARTGNGRVRFHKDGYTDLRGRFDYVSLTGRQDGDPQRFAILVLDEKRGAEIREVSPPLR